MNKEDIFWMSACDIVEIIKRQDLTAVEITEAFIERIEKINPKINAYCTPTLNMAREQAKKADNIVKKGEKYGPLLGVPTSIKDLTEMEGVRTTFGSKIYENYVPKQDDIAVKRLKEAGCVILGKTNTPEFGHQAVTDNFIFGRTNNPWNLERTSGGSSGGAAAAVVSGLCTVAQGSDGGGSVRIPSCLCGAFGIKPSHGRIPHHPRIGMGFALLSDFGPITRYVADAALMLDVMKQPFDADHESLPDNNISYLDAIKERPKKLKIGYSLSLGFCKALDPDVRENIINAVNKFENIDWVVEEAKIKIKDPELAFGTLVSSTLAHDLKSTYEKRPEILSPNLVKLIQLGLNSSAVDYVSGLLMRRKIYEKLYNFFKDYDILVTPTTAVPAFEHGIMYPKKIGGKAASPTKWMSFTYPFNMTGLPAASIPCGWSSDGLPIGMQIIGKKFDDLTVLQASKAFEEIAPWQDKKPKLD
ncbi:MAG: amidase [Candidatus Helarchaeota archaeon]